MLSSAQDRCFRLAMGQPPMWTVLSLLVGLGSSNDCLVPSPSVRSSQEKKAKTELSLESFVNEELEIMWVDFDGSEKYVRDIPAGGVTKESTQQGHVFRAYSKTDPRHLVMEHKVASPNRAEIFIVACGDLSVFQKSRRAKEFEELAFRGNGSTCDGEDSAKWSCARRLDGDDLALRDPSLFGLAEGEAESGQHEHGFADGTYVRQISGIAQVTKDGPGYLRMRFTPKLMEAMHWWQKHVAEHGAGKREFVAGGYTNAKSHELSIMSLDNHRGMHGIITQEMHDILEWWTGMPLTHTATYGVRTYHRGSVLIDHVDRHDTHVASAVLQMSQQVDVGGGWPLEVLLTNDRVGEVYLQPGELVLYEGAWLRHGRPMRFRGDNFSNVFTHFRPRDWEENKAELKKGYYGIPADRGTTVADHGVVKTDQYGFLAKKSVGLHEAEM